MAKKKKMERKMILCIKFSQVAVFVKILDPTSIVPVKIPDPISIATFNSGPNSDTAEQLFLANI